MVVPRSTRGVHTIDADRGAAKYGSGGVVDVLDYWRESLLDAVPADLAPRQLAVIDWLSSHVPSDAERHTTRSAWVIHAWATPYFKAAT